MVVHDLLFINKFSKWRIPGLNGINQLIFISLKMNFLQWSFGVLLWEIITRGVVPYSNIDQRYQLTHLKRGGRLSKPEHCKYAL